MEIGRSRLPDELVLRRRGFVPRVAACQVVRANERPNSIRKRREKSDGETAQDGCQRHASRSRYLQILFGEKVGPAARRCRGKTQLRAGPRTFPDGRNRRLRKSRR